MFENYSCPLPDAGLYLERIHMPRPAFPDLQSLNEMIYHHQCHVPFEDLDSSLLHVPLSLEIPALFDKIVTRRRGGYCFEMNGLFVQLLQDLGYSARSVFCRIIRGRSELPPCRHRAILVEINDQLYFCDVGFGGPMPAGAVPLSENTPVTYCGETFFMNQSDHDWWTLSRITSDGSTEAVIMFCTLPQIPADFIAINYFCSEHPSSIFTRSQIVNLRTPDGHLSITDREFVISEGGMQTTTVIENEKKLQEILDTRFGIRLQGGVYEIR